MPFIFCRGFRIIVSNGGFSLMNTSIHLGFPLSHLPFTVRLLSSYPKHKERPFVVSYLIDSCGLSPESAISASKKIDFKTSDRPDSAISLLKHYGFTSSHISKLVNKYAPFLLADPAKILRPKLEFLCSICVSSSDVVEIVCYNPLLLHWSLQEHLIPTHNMLKSILGSDKKVIQGLKRSVLKLNDMHTNVPINITLLRELKVPQENISFLLTFFPNILYNDPCKFSDIVNKVIKLGLDPSRYVFVRAFAVVSGISYKTWEQKMEVFRSLGFTEEQILGAFTKFPSIMSLSAKKIMSVMDFIVDKMGYRLDAVICNPSIFCYSLEKRIIPRFSVIRVLQSKALVKADISISSVITKTEKNFLNDFVIKYEGEIPELSSLYVGKTSILELGCRFEVEKLIVG
ncbi:transcription termination factor MTERF2, chloroplastic-like [Euphorbia lathyris]|uniref:transcription termination factor MTERF2, chloroplastic-like n=1 Tax=Euphorbia lathyris TaxID=212925 RepID=UPI0033143278